MGIEGFYEAISQDEGFSKLRRKVESDNSNNALLLCTRVNLKDVVLSPKGVFVASNDEVQSWEGWNDRAVNLFLLSSSKSLGHVVNNLGWANKDGCSSINNT